MKYAIQIRDDEELFGYLDTEEQPTAGLLYDMMEGQMTQEWIASIPPDRWQFHPVH